MESTHKDTHVAQLLSVAEACARLNVSRQLLYRLISDGLPVVKIGDRTLFRPSDLEALVARSVRTRREQR